MTATRTPAINVQQLIALLTGILYGTIGAVFFLSPIFLMRFLNMNVNNEWASQMRYDNFLALIYLAARLLSGLLFFTGTSMILPLYDPIRYRELIYFNGIFFPVFATLFFLKKVLDYGMSELTVFTLFFAIIAVMNAIGLYITRQHTRNR